MSKKKPRWKDLPSSERFVKMLKQQGVSDETCDIIRKKNKKQEVREMEFTEMEEVRVRTWGGAIGTIEKVVYEKVNGEETDNVYCYEMEINGQHGIIVYPEEIDE